MHQQMALEGLRVRIATDLHDDLGSSLSQVAIMSEVVSRRLETERPALEEIAAKSRELLVSMSEIVWTVDPRCDAGSDLTQRMRWFAGETLSGIGVAHCFYAAEDISALRLNADVRRHVYLIFKECVHNIVRHSEAARAKFQLFARQGWVVLCVEDDGRGFDPRQAAAGHGLRNMAARAKLLGGQLDIVSRPGEGSSVLLRVPLCDSKVAWRRWLRLRKRNAVSNRLTE
jgi:signal transduction histidine kinase